MPTVEPSKAIWPVSLPAKPVRLSVVFEPAGPMSLDRVTFRVPSGAAVAAGVRVGVVAGVGVGDELGVDGAAGVGVEATVGAAA